MSIEGSMKITSSQLVATVATMSRWRSVDRRCSESRGAEIHWVDFLKRIYLSREEFQKLVLHRLLFRPCSRYNNLEVANSPSQGGENKRRPLHTDAPAQDTRFCSILDNIQSFYYNLQRPKERDVIFRGIEASSRSAATVLFAEDQGRFASRQLRLAVRSPGMSTSQDGARSDDSSVRARLADGIVEELLVWWAA